MVDLVIPTIGSTGLYVLKSPLNTLIVKSEKYTCLAIRNISEYLANNEDAKDMAYIKNGLTESEYNADYKNDAIIISLRADTGHWLYVPAKYIASYPITNGVPYRACMVAASLPSIPTNKNLTFLENAIRSLVIDYLGVTPLVKTVETSRTVLVSREIHDSTELERSIIINNNSTDTAKYNKLLLDHQTALDKITALEQYIRDNFT